jgi:hypothetical protein
LITSGLLAPQSELHDQFALCLAIIAMESTFRVISEEERAALGDVIRRCKDACEAGDVSQIEKFFQSGQLNQDDANKCLLYTFGSMNVEAARCLLESGAEASSIPLGRLVQVCDLDMLKLFAEFGLDVKTVGHNFLPYVPISLAG